MWRTLWSDYMMNMKILYWVLNGERILLGLLCQCHQVQLYWFLMLSQMLWNIGFYYEWLIESVKICFSKVYLSFIFLWWMNNDLDIITIFFNWNYGIIWDLNCIFQWWFNFRDKIFIEDIVSYQFFDLIKFLYLVIFFQCELLRDLSFASLDNDLFNFLSVNRTSI